MAQSTAKQETGAEQIRWDLSDLFKSINDPQIDTILAATEKKARQFEKQYKGKLSALTPEQLKAALEELESLIAPIYKVSQYVHLLYAIDTLDNAIKAKVSKVEEIESKIGNHLVFFDLEIGAMPNNDYKKFDNAPALSNYAYHLSQTRKTAPYNLSEKEEQIINLKNLTGSRAFKKLYNELTSSFRFEFEVDGEKKIMNGSELRVLRQHRDPAVRRSAMALFFSRHEEHRLVLTHAYTNIIKNAAIERELRGYKTPISPKNIHNDLSDDVVQMLHDVTTESNRLVQRYYKLKAKIINLPDLTLADIYAPMPQSDKKYTWQQCKEIIMDSFGAFDDEIYGMVKLMFDKNRIDAPVLPSKRGGAFCSGSTPDIKPYIMVNYLGKLSDVSTLAHELGHAIHDMLCSRQTLINYSPILPLAETASVFSEMIITDKLLKNETDVLTKQALLTDKLEDIFATSHRQNMFSRFELQAHKQSESTLPSTEELCELYKKELRLMFGESVRYTDEYQWEWSSVPHIYESPFYVYAYNFGNLLVMALYQQYLEEGKSFIPRYKEFLAAGSSASPADITAIVGADIQKPEFWQKSITYIETLITRLESLVTP